MYTFTNKLRNLSIILMVAGFLGLTYGFLTAPNTLKEAVKKADAEEMLKQLTEAGATAELK